MFIETEATPDPAKLKFLPGREVLPEGTLYLKTREQAAMSPLAQRLFDVPGVIGVSLGPDSIIVTRADSEWQRYKPVILGMIMEHFVSGAPVVQPPAKPADAPADDGPMRDGRAGDGPVGEILQALRLVIDPELGYNIVDLGLIYDVSVADGGATTVTMTTTTPGCPATNYLRSGAGEAASGVAGVQSVEVELTYEPRWTPEMMSPEAKEHFGITDRGGW